MKDDAYNGWPNRETWAFVLHVDNDPAFYDIVREIAGDIVAVFDDADVRSWRLARALNLWAATTFTATGYEHGDRMPEAVQQIAEKIGSLWRVDFDCVAESLLNELA